MKRHTRCTRRKARGFTLLEIIAVLVIIGMMVGFGVPMVMNHIENARQQEAVTQTRIMADALRQFNMHVRHFPSEQEGLDALLHRPADADGWSGPYIQDWRRIPKDPWGNEYQYVLSQGEGGVETPQVVSLGRDKNPGGTGLNSDVVNGQLLEEEDTIQ